jgi:hypothetical protein
VKKQKRVVATSVPINPITGVPIVKTPAEAGGRSPEELYLGDEYGDNEEEADDV